MLSKPRTIYGRFAYLATLMVESGRDVKATPEGSTSIGKIPRRLVKNLHPTVTALGCWIHLRLTNPLTLL